MIPFEEIDDRLKTLGKNRAWLAQVSGRSEGAIRAALAPNAIAKSRSELLQRALSDAIEKEEIEQRRGAILPDRVTLEISPDEFEAFNEAALGKQMTLKKWAIKMLNEAALAQRNTISFPSAGSSQAKSAAEEFPPLRENPAHLVMLKGSVAAGGKSFPGDLEEAELPTDKKYPANHYAVRVLGHSMEPTIPHESVIVVKAFLDQGFPRKGSIVVYDDGHGTTLKEFGYSQAEDGDEHARLGKIPVLRSINPDFPDVEPIEGGRIIAVFVEVLKP